MSPRSRKRRAKEAEAPASAWHGCAVLLGLVVLPVSLLVLDLTLRITSFWLSRDDYVRTELEVTDVDVGVDSEGMFGIVAATGEEIRVGRLPLELYEHDSPSDPIGTRMTPEQAKGKKIPIWYAAGHTSFWDSPAVQFVSEYPERPDGSTMAGPLCITLAMAGIGAGLVWWGLRPFRHSDEEESR